MVKFCFLVHMGQKCTSWAGGPLSPWTVKGSKGADSAISGVIRGMICSHPASCGRKPFLLHDKHQSQAKPSDPDSSSACGPCVQRPRMW